MLSKVLLIVGVFGFAAAIAGFWYYKTQTDWVESASYAKPTNDPAKVLVVSFSRTGNTEAAAKVAAEYFDADFLKIDAPNYANDLKGLKKASDDAMAEVVSSPISHPPVDLNQYELIILSAPTWWFRPAVPIWSFVENHDFHNKRFFF